MPIALPISGDWLLRIVGSKDRFVFGVYRRHVRTIGYLGQIDKLVGAPATTRNWNTIAVIVRVLRDQEKIGRENKKLPPRGSKLPARELSARIRS